jgi:putative membrane protein
VDVALPAPSLAGLATAWTWQPLALAAAALLAGWYARALGRLRSARRPTVWPARRVALFGAGLLALCYTTCGFPGAYVSSVFWLWTVQQLALLLVVPYLILAGEPLQLARAVHGESSPVARFLRSRVVRTLGSPLIGPALVPVLSVVLFFGPLPRWAIDITGLGWIEQLLVLVIGGLVVLPLVGADAPRTSLAVGLSLAIGSLELVLDAVPGIALRLHRTLSTSYFDSRELHPWTPVALHDQQIAGGVLWCVAELLDLPFLVLVFRQWLKADARDAAEIDAVLEAERIARGEEEPAGEIEHGPTDAPWWLSDPGWQDRMRRPR